MDVLKIALDVLLVITGLFLTLLILMHKGNGGGMSEMFGGSMSSTMGGSSVAERNLNRITIGTGVIWGFTIVLLGLIQKFAV